MFNIEAAKEAGYTQKEIAQYLAQSSGFDYEGAFSAGYTDEEIIQGIQQRQPEQPTTVPEKQQQPAFDTGELPSDVSMAGISDIQTGFTPAEQMAQQYEHTTTTPLPTAPEIGDAPELNEMTMPAFASSLGLLFSGDTENAKKVLQKQFPEATFSTDDQGNEMISLPSGDYKIRGTGQKTASLLAQGLSFVPAGSFMGGFAAGSKLGLAGKAGVQALGAGATQAGMEGFKTMAGGEFEAAPVAIATVAGGASEVVLPAFQAIRQAIPFGKSTVQPRSTLNAETISAGQAPEDMSTEAISDLLKKSKSKLAAMQARPDAEIKQAADDLGIVLNPGAYSSSRAFQEVEQSLKSIPGSTVSTVEAKAIADLGKKADELVESVSIRDVSLLDSQIKDEFETTITALESKSIDLYAKLNEAIPKMVKADNFSSKQYITQRLAELGGDESLLSSAEKQLLRFTKGEAPTYGALDQTRKNIGHGFKGKGVFKDDETGILNQVYRVISEDQQRIADALGHGEAYAAARKLVQSRKQVEDEAVQLFGKQVNQSIIPKINLAANAITKGDISKLESLMKALPEHRRTEAAGAMLAQLFTSGSRSAKEGIGQGFVNAYVNLNRNKQAKNVFFKYLPIEARERFDKIGKVATGLFRAQNLENKSRTARDVIAALNNGGMFSKVYDVGKKVAVAEGATTSAGLPGVGSAAVLGSAFTKGKTPASEAADKLLTSPEFEKAMIKAMNNQEAQAERLLSTSKHFRSWLSTIDRDTASQILRSGFIPWIISEE